MSAGEGLVGLNDPLVISTADDDADAVRAEQDAIVGVGCFRDGFGRGRCGGGSKRGGDVHGAVSFADMNVAHAEAPPVRISLEAVLGVMRGRGWPSVPRTWDATRRGL